MNCCKKCLNLKTEFNPKLLSSVSLQQFSHFNWNASARTTNWQWLLFFFYPHIVPKPKSNTQEVRSLEARSNLYKNICFVAHILLHIKYDNYTCDDFTNYILIKISNIWTFLSSGKSSLALIPCFR